MKHRKQTPQKVKVIMDVNKPIFSMIIVHLFIANVPLAIHVRGVVRLPVLLLLCEHTYTHKKKQRSVNKFSFWVSFLATLTAVDSSHPSWRSFLHKPRMEYTKRKLTKIHKPGMERSTNLEWKDPQTWNGKIHKPEMERSTNLEWKDPQT